MTIIDILHDSRLTTQPVAGKLRECEYNSMYTLRKEKNRLLSTQQYVCNSHLTPCTWNYNSYNQDVYVFISFTAIRHVGRLLFV
jgi:hypothetical protein